jgi:2-haloacid dehalogenase
MTAARSANGDFPMEIRISALVFDAYGTLFDVHSVTRMADSHFPGKGAQLSQAWRVKQLEYTWLRSLMGRYEHFNHVTRASLDFACASLGLAASEAAKQSLMEEYRRLAVFPEVHAALAQLGATRKLAILSNGHPDMLDAVVRHNGLEKRLSAWLSVDPAGIFKPHPSVYQLAVDALGVPKESIGFVSSNGWDAQGAKSFGMRTIWVNRGGAPVDGLGFPPEAIVRDLSEVEAALGIAGAAA